MSKKAPSEEVIDLNIDQEVPKDLVGPDKPSKLFRQGGRIFRLYNTPLHSYLRYNEKTTEKLCEKPKYDPKMIYMIRKQWSDYKISFDTFRTVMNFFRKIFKEYKAECGLILMVNLETKNWKLLVPLQVGTSGSLDYYMPAKEGADVPDKVKADYKKIWADPDWNRLMTENLEEYQKLLDEGYVVYGTIHSHCDFSAFHSGVDDQDEYKNDGLHITIGNVDDKFSYSARYTVNGAEWKIEDIRDVVDVKDINALKKNIDDVPVPQVYLDRFIDDLNPVPSWQGKAQNLYQNTHGGWRDYGTRQYSGSSFYDRNYDPDWNGYNADNFTDTSKDVEYVLSNGDYISEKNSVRVFDKVTKTVYVIRWYIFNQYKDYFLDKRFIELPDADVPKAVRKLMD